MTLLRISAPARPNFARPQQIAALNSPPLRKAMQAAEKTVETLTKELAKADALLADPALYQDAAKAQRISMERGLIAKKLADAEETWFSATTAYEEANAEQ